MYIPLSLFLLASAISLPFQARVGRSAAEAKNVHPNHSASEETEQSEAHPPQLGESTTGEDATEPAAPGNVTIYGRIFCARLVEEVPARSAAEDGRRKRRFTSDLNDLYGAHGYHQQPDNGYEHTNSYVAPPPSTYQQSQKPQVSSSPPYGPSPAEPAQHTSQWAQPSLISIGPHSIHHQQQHMQPPPAPFLSGNSKLSSTRMSSTPQFIVQPGSGGGISPTTSSEKQQWQELSPSDDPFIDAGAGFARSEQQHAPANAVPFDSQAEQLSTILLGEPSKHRRHRRSAIRRNNVKHVIRLEPASNVLISVYRRRQRPFEVPQLLAETHTDADGYFEFTTTDDEFHQLHPFLVVSHGCSPIELKNAYRSAKGPSASPSRYIDYFPISGTAGGEHGDSMWKLLVIGVEDWEGFH